MSPFCNMWCSIACRRDTVIDGTTSESSVEISVASCEVTWDSDQGWYKVDCAVPPVNLAGNWSLSASIDGETFCSTQIRMKCPMLEYETPFSDPVGECVGCVEGVICDSPGSVLSTLQLEVGYWRPGPTSVNVWQCIHPRACIGGTGENNTYCRRGYDGPLCAVCEMYYFRSWSSGQCVRCADGNSHLASSLVFGLM